MRLFWRVKRFIAVVLSGMFCVIFMLTVRFVNLTRLSDIDGERTYFLDSSSSQALRKSSISLQDVGRVKGERVNVAFSQEDGGRYASKEDYDRLAHEIADKYKAKILFTEEVLGTVSYYAHTWIWSDGIAVNGQKVNLHIAIGESGYVVGTPLIFDGY